MHIVDAGMQYAYKRGCSVFIRCPRCPWTDGSARDLLPQELSALAFRRHVREDPWCPEDDVQLTLTAQAWRGVGYRSQCMYRHLWIDTSRSIEHDVDSYLSTRKCWNGAPVVTRAMRSGSAMNGARRRELSCDSTHNLTPSSTC